SFGTIGRLEYAQHQHSALQPILSTPLKKDDSRLTDFFLPLLLLVSFTFLGFYLSGKCAILSSDLHCIHAMENINVAPSLFFASLASVIIYFAYLLLRGTL